MKVARGKFSSLLFSIFLTTATSIAPFAVRSANASCEIQPGQITPESGCESPGTLGGNGAGENGGTGANSGGGGGNVPEVYVYLSIDGNIYYTTDKLTAGSYALANGLAQGTRFALTASSQTTTYWIYKGLGVAVPFGG